MNTVPLVSVWMVTYNHQDYITQAVESVMMQQTDFNVHLFIGEDFSSDNTRIVCQSLKNKYPHQISLILNRKNLGANKNARNIYKACFNSGAKYIAMLEGDDYWTDPLKLQKQVDFLEKNSDFIICFHKVKILTNEGLVNDFITENRFDKIKEFPITQQSLYDHSNFIQTPSVMFRNIINSLPLEFKYSPVGDYLLYFVLTNHGYIHRIENVMAVYRYGNGNYSKLKNEEKNIISEKFQICLLSYTDSDYIKERIIKNLFNKIDNRQVKNVDYLTTKKLLKKIIQRGKNFFKNDKKY